MSSVRGVWGRGEKNNYEEEEEEEEEAKEVGPCMVKVSGGCARVRGELACHNYIGHKSRMKEGTSAQEVPVGQ